MDRHPVDYDRMVDMFMQLHLRRMETVKNVNCMLRMHLCISGNIKIKIFQGEHAPGPP